MPTFPTGGASGAYGSVASYTLDMTGLQNLINLADVMAERLVRYCAFRGAAKARLNIRAVDAIDTGFMVNTTRARQVSRFLWSIGTAAAYGVFIEYGTVHMAARPWLAPAIGEMRALLDTMIRVALRELPSGHINVPLDGGD